MCNFPFRMELNWFISRSRLLPFVKTSFIYHTKYVINSNILWNEKLMFLYMTIRSWGTTICSSDSDLFDIISQLQDTIKALACYVLNIYLTEHYFFCCIEMLFVEHTLIFNNVGDSSHLSCDTSLPWPHWKCPLWYFIRHMNSKH